MKVVKFRDYLIPLVVSGKKTSTWRLFDNKNLSVGDKIGLREFGKEENFAQAIITKVVVTKFKDLKSEDKLGHEK